MIRLQQLRIPAAEKDPVPELEHRIRRRLHLPADASFTYRILQHTIDARKKPLLFHVYTVCCDGIPGEERLIARLRDKDILKDETIAYTVPETGNETLHSRPVVVGAGPAGLFCALLLSMKGFSPLVLERGGCVRKRREDIEKFWRTGMLDPDSNVQFGEGGAGTFSDGKLNTQIRDPEGRIRFILETFAAAGAPEDILYEAKPHIGTDHLQEMTQNLRKRIESLGGEFLFQTRMEELVIRDGRIAGLRLSDGRSLAADAVILATGHSARDTFRSLLAQGVPMQAKDFAIGMRVSHPQAMINARQYGIDEEARIRLHLPAASYKLTKRVGDRGVYSFCMCPGGYVVNASSEPARLTVNGMSEHQRDSKRANSGIIVTVRKSDYPGGGEDPLSGVLFQERLEEKAFALGGGKIPVQKFRDYLEGQLSSVGGESASGDPEEELCVCGGVRAALLNELLPADIDDAFRRGMAAFDRKIPGFAGKDAWLLGLEARTSSPVRIPRDAHFQSAVHGLYPCGEGAGYAGGIVSAATDGMKVAEEIIRSFKPGEIKKK
ncbi:MAG: FAD-dependent oxidoreductase [Lachnospiraceae bacterium]|nr:FAD-dependent oxidoreductase [Lachnospiraceae bacterium]